MRVSIIAMTDLVHTTVEEATNGAWSPEPYFDDASALAEFAGRNCYQSWGRPNPATATNDGYLRNIINQRHFSVLEHGSVSFLIAAVSRSLTHELVRHRIASFSQLSQRYVDMAGVVPVIPPLYRSQADGGMEDPETGHIIESLWGAVIPLYERLYTIWYDRLTARRVPHIQARKMAREAARCVLPNMVPTQLVMTMNHRAIREFLVKRGSIHADHEIRNLAIEMHRLVTMIEPNIYPDLVTDTVLVGDRHYPIIREVPSDHGDA
jgi:thymidylate synthase (FAD)